MRSNKEQKTEKPTSENPLKSVLQRLEKITEEVSRTQAYNEETEKLRMLLELTREQVQNENSIEREGRKVVRKIWRRRHIQDSCDQFQL